MATTFRTMSNRKDPRMVFVYCDDVKTVHAVVGKFTGKGNIVTSATGAQVPSFLLSQIKAKLVEAGLVDFAAPTAADNAPF